MDHIISKGQCYDGASAMKGKRNGLKTLVLEEYSAAVYIHCYAHSLQLAVQDCTKNNPVVKDALELCSEIGKMVKNSPKREAKLRQIQSQIQDGQPSASNIRLLCPTR